MCSKFLYKFSLNSFQIHVPSIYTHRIVCHGSDTYRKPFERLITRDAEGNTTSEGQLANGAGNGNGNGEKSREVIARRAALEFQDGMYGKEEMMDTVEVIGTNEIEVSRGRDETSSNGTVMGIMGVR